MGLGSDGGGARAERRGQSGCNGQGDGCFPVQASVSVQLCPSGVVGHL